MDEQRDVEGVEAVPDSGPVRLNRPFFGACACLFGEMREICFRRRRLSGRDENPALLCDALWAVRSTVDTARH